MKAGFLTTMMILSTLFGGNSLAQSEDVGVYAVPIDWQRVELQKTIEEKLTEAIEAVVERPKFIVHVNLRLAAGKSFGVDQGKAKNGDAFPLAKLGINKDSAAYKRALLSGTETVFSRLAGMVVTLSLDQTVTSIQEKQAREFISSVTQAYGGGRVDVRTKRIRFVGDAFQRSRNLEIARVNLEAAKSIGEAILKSNMQIANAINAAAGKEPAEIKEDGSIKEKDVNKVPELPKTWQEAVMVFKLPIGILAATLLLLLFVSGFKTIESQKVAVMAAQVNQAKAAAEAQQNNQVKSEDPDRDQGEMLAVREGLATGGSGSGEGGFDQFRRMAEQYPETAAYLIKLWLNMETSESQRAIAALTKMVPVETLVPVFGGLDDDLKLKLKKASLMIIDATSIQRAEGFIVEQMVENFLVNTVELPDDLKTLLSSMTITDCVECIKRDSRLGAAFINILQASQVGRILKMLPEEEISGLFDEGLSFTQDSIQSLAATLHPMLMEIRQDKAKHQVPLVNKAVELIRYLGPEKEHEVFKMLISSGATEQILEATNRYFPAELILTLPADKLRILLGRMPTNQRAALIYSREEEERKILLEAIGATGRLREIINDEFREIEKNESMKAQIQKDRAKLWGDFVQISRDSIRNDGRVKDTADELLKKWLSNQGVDTDWGSTEQAA
ncbi:MAG: hypothetical protein H6624_00760 [Bdellovibrionaceae bacterium]|nr:hypothetical protein [Bdellovibrionales bacterium]MCB9082839.1 hypothetical protein [Pseudobdellovibrionaceae bacterium]